MPVNTPHPEAARMAERWIRCRDAYEGTYAVKGRGVDYLPRLSDQTVTEYSAYKYRALFYGATARTVSSLTGSAMRKDPTWELPAGIDYTNNITGTGTALTEFAKNVIKELIITGRHGILVDMAVDGSQPYLTSYTAESILNWKTDENNNLVRVVLNELINISDPEDPYVQLEVEQCRELVIDEGIYKILIHQKNEKSNWIVIDIIIPTKNSVFLKEIPFIFLNENGVSTAVNKPPLLDLIDVNLSHYVNSADLEHGRHFTGLPTPWAAGLDDKQTEVKLGSSTFLVLADGGSAGFLEFTGQGLTALEKGLESKEHMMAVLGARMLEAPKKAAETEGKARIDAQGEGSVLASIVGSGEAGILKALQFAAAWGNSPGTVIFAMNKDFLQDTADAVLIVTMMQQVQGGLISYQSYFDFMKKNEIIPAERTVEDEVELIENQVIVPLSKPGDDDGS